MLPLAISYQGKSSPTFSSPTFSVDARFVIKYFTEESVNIKIQYFESIMILLHLKAPSTLLLHSEILRN